MSGLGEHPPNIEEIKAQYEYAKSLEGEAKERNQAWIDHLEEALEEYYEHFDPEVDGIG